MQAVLGLVVLALFLFGAGSAGAADFYEGKKIRLIVSSSPGGGNDTYSRLLARNIGRHIPGNPTIIVQNMPGAGGVRAASYLYNKARRDGTVMEQINWGVWNWQVVGDKARGGQFDFNKMQAIGVIIIENGLIYSRKDRFKSLDDIKKSGKPARVGISGNQSGGFVMGNILEKLRGEKLFEYIFGYPGARQYSLALRQGEVDASGNVTSSFLDQLGDMWKEGKLVMLAQTGTVEGKKAPEFPNAPLLEDLAKTEKQKNLVRATFLLSRYGRPYTMPPGVPADRVALVRKAFDETMKDPKFLAEAKRFKRPVNPTNGVNLQRMWKESIAASPEDKAIVTQIFNPKGKK
jgi:tripartite-type tricarboxylate transporter receptor subunit TctC